MNLDALTESKTHALTDRAVKNTCKLCPYRKRGGSGWVCNYLFAAVTIERSACRGDTLKHRV